MRVLLLGPYPPPHGGVQTHVVAIRDALRARGMSCAVVNVTRHRRPDADDVYYPRSARELLGLLARLRYDVVHLHVGGALPVRVLGLALACALRPGARSVFTLHSGGYPSSPEGLTARPATLRGLVFRRYDRLIGVNAEIVQLFRRFGVPAERTRLILPHAIPSDGESGAAPLPPALAPFFAEHAPVLLSVGLLEPEYDLPRQIEVLDRVRARHPRAGLVLVGSGSLEPALRERIAATAYAPHVLLCGDVPHADTLRAIARCDALLRTTLYDGDSISVREALHLGTPVVATDNGMRPPGVRLVPVSDTAALDAGIEAALAAPRGGGVRPGAAEAPGDDGEDNIAAVVRVYEELVGAR